MELIDIIPIIVLTFCFIMMVVICLYDNFTNGDGDMDDINEILIHRDRDNLFQE